MDFALTFLAACATGAVGVALGFWIGWSEYQQWFGQRYGGHPETIARHCNRLLTEGRR